MTNSGNGTSEPITFRSKIQAPSAIATVILLFGGIILALTPYVIFHSRQYGIYDWYHIGGMVVGFLSLIPANIWLFSVMWLRIVKPVVIILMVLITASAGFILFWIFAFIYLATVDWFTF